MLKIKKTLLSFIVGFQKFINRWWYGPSIAFLAAMDNLVLIIPNDGLLISASMLSPKKWFHFAVWIAIGSTIGAMVLALLVKIYGFDFLHLFDPAIETTNAWIKTEEFFDVYGLIVVFIVAVTPLVQQPAVALAALAGTPIFYIAAVVFVGRGIKFLIMSWVASHAPKMLSKLWGLESEMKEMGLVVEPSDTSTDKKS